MGRGEEFTRRKQNKSARKRMRADGGDLNPEESAAAKRRRRKGARRITEAMCYSLPTPENPFNEAEVKAKLTKKFHLKTHNRKVVAGLAGKLVLGSVKSVRRGGASKVGAGKDGGKDGGKKIDPLRVRKTLWPVGVESKEGLRGLSDARLPPGMTRLDEELREADRERRGTGGSGLVEEEEGEGGRWQKVKTGCWEGCLRGLDVLATTPRQHNQPVSEPTPTSGPTSNGSSNGVSKPHRSPAPTSDTDQTNLESVLCILAPALMHIRAQAPPSTGGGPLALLLVSGSEQSKRVRGLLRGLGDWGGEDKMGVGTGEEGGEGGGREVKRLRSVAVHEDAAIEYQAGGLEVQAVDLVVGTINRIWTLMDSGALALNRVSFLVLDQADRFDSEEASKQLLDIRARVHIKCQAVILSSTWPLHARHLAHSWLRDPIFRACGNESDTAACACIDLEVDVCTSEDKKMAKLLKLVDQIRSEASTVRVKTRILVQVNADVSVGPAVAALTSAKHRCAGLHSGMGVEQQRLASTEFRIGKVPILVITESERTAHNLNLGAVPTLVILNFPSTLGRYKEAVKSVCRSVTRGKCVTYFMQDEAESAPELVEFLEGCGQAVDSKLVMIAKAVNQVRGQIATIVKQHGVNGGRAERQRL